MHLITGNLHDWRPSSISTPKISLVKENGQGLGVNKKGTYTIFIGSFESKRKKNTTNNEKNDSKIKLELMRITIIATTVAMKMIMGKKVSDNNNNYSTNEQMKS